MGEKLLIRTRAGVSPTDVGVLLLKKARQLLEDLDQIETELRAANSEETVLSLGLTTTSGRELVSSLVDGVRKSGETRKYRMSLREGRSDELLALMRNRQLHAALSYDDSADPKDRAIPLYDEEFVLVGRPAVMRITDPFATEEVMSSVSLVVSPAEQGSRSFLEREARQRGMTFKFDLEMSSASLKEQMLLRHDKCMIVPYARFLPEIEKGELLALHFMPRLSRTMRLHVHHSLPEHAREFLTAIVQSSVRRLIVDACVGWTLPREQAVN